MQPVGGVGGVLGLETGVWVEQGQRAGGRAGGWVGGRGGRAVRGMRAPRTAHTRRPTFSTPNSASTTNTQYHVEAPSLRPN